MESKHTKEPNLMESFDAAKAETVAYRNEAIPALVAAVESVLKECVLAQKHWGSNSNNKEAAAAQEALIAALATLKGE